MKFNTHIIATILKKDFLCLYPLVLLATAAFVADVFIVRLELLQMWDFFQMPLIMLVSTVLIMGVFQLDAPVSVVDDWLCRPVPRKELLTAKLVLVFAVVYASRAVAVFITSLMLGYGVTESLLEAVLLQDMFFQLVLPTLLIAAVVTNTLVQGIGALTALFIAVFVIPSGFLEPPGPLQPGIGDQLSQNGMGWMAMAPAKVAPLLMVGLCYWLVYWRRRIVAGRVMLVATTAATLFFVTLPMWLLPYDAVHSLQASMLSQDDVIDEGSADNIGLHSSQLCFPAARFGELASNDAFRAARQVSGLIEWDEEAIADIGPDALSFLTVMQVTGLPLEWRAKMTYVEANLYAGDEREPRYSLRPSSYINDNGGGDTLAHDWLLPQEALQTLEAAGDVRLDLTYSLALLRPESFELAADGVRRHLPGLGYCSAGINTRRNRIDVDCFIAGSKPAQLSAEMFDIAPSRVYAPINMAPGFVEWPHSLRYELAIDSPGLAAHNKILITAWHSAGLVQKSRTTPGILGADRETCSLPAQGGGNRLQRSRWSDSAPHETLFLSAAEGVQLEVLDFGGDGLPMLLIPGLGATAHSFDTLAPKLAENNRVYAMTRRGTGASTKVDFGFDQDRLARDIIAVLDALELPRAILVGHSIAGDELSWLGARYPERIHGLVYLDAAYDRSGAAASRRLRELNASLPPEPPRRTEDILNYEAYKALQDSRLGPHLPEGELIAFYNITNPYLAGTPDMDMRVAQSIEAHIGPPDYAAIEVPALAVYAVAGDEPRLRPWYDTNDADLMADLRELGEIAGRIQQENIERFKNEVPKGQVIVLPGAEHWIFLSNEVEVLQAIDEFVDSLPH